MEHFDSTESVNSTESSSRGDPRRRRRPRARWVAVLGAAGFAAMTIPLGGATPGHAATEASEGLLCEHNAGGTPTNPTSSFVLTAKEGYILTPDNNSIYMWSYSAGNKPFQYPGTTLCVNEGDTVTVTLKNTLKVPTSVMFLGIEGVLADGALSVPQPGTDSLTEEAASGGSVTYQFVAKHAGTYLYESGTNPQLQDQMGLVGALVVRPAGYTDAAPYAYNLAGGAPDTDTSYKPTKEYLNLFSEVDPDLHQRVEFAPDQNGYVVDWTAYRPRYWMINGRVFPDTIAANDSQSLPAQPYSALVHIQPRDDVNNPLPALVRMLNAGARTYPFHPHGNHDKVIGIDARPLRGTDGSDLTRDEFSVVMVPGQTEDVVVTWVDGQGFATDAPGIGVPVPPLLNRENGAYWSGSPYLGEKEAPKSGQLQLNECGEYYNVAHSHALYQVATYETAASGMLTMTRIDPPGDEASNGCHPAGEG